MSSHTNSVSWIFHMYKKVYVKRLGCYNIGSHHQQLKVIQEINQTQVVVLFYMLQAMQ